SSTAASTPGAADTACSSGTSHRSSMDIVAPLLAEEHGSVPRVRGVAVLSTVEIAWCAYELTNLRRQLRLQRLAPDSIEVSMRLKTRPAHARLVGCRHEPRRTHRADGSHQPDAPRGGDVR